MMKKRKFGSGGMPSMKESMESGNRVSRQVGAETKKLMPATRSTRPSVGDAIASGNRMSKKNAEDLKAVKKYAKGGKVKPVDIDMKGLEEASRSTSSLPKADLETKAAEARKANTARAKETSDAAKGKSFKEAFNEARKEQGPNGVFTWRGNAYNTKMAGETSKAGRAATPPAAPRATPTPTPTPPPPPTESAKPDNKALNARADQIMKERESSFFKRQLTKAEALEEAARKPTPAPSVTRGYADRGARVLTEREKRVAKNAATEAARANKPNIFTRMYDMTVNPGMEQEYAKGGSVSKRGDGCAVRGKTKGKIY